jgi:hypothetical protein
MKALLNSLTEAELALVRETEPDSLTGLDEDALVALHARVRRNRDKYVNMYRREASVRVSEYGGRGKARPKNLRNAQKAEVFEDALARVSHHLAVAARRSANALRAARLAAARAARTGAPSVARAGSTPRSRATAAMTVRRAAPAKRTAPAGRAKASPAARKRQASGMAAGARRQARRDSR